MATMVRVIRLDDVELAEGRRVEADGLIRFALDGVDFEVDLGSGNDKRLRDVLAPYIDAGRRVKLTSGNKRRPIGGGDQGYSPGEVRDWLRKRGIPVHPRGRIKRDLLEKYLNRNNSSEKNDPASHSDCAQEGLEHHG